MSMTVTAKRTVHSVGVASLDQASLCNWNCSDTGDSRQQRPARPRVSLSLHLIRQIFSFSAKSAIPFNVQTVVGPRAAACGLPGLEEDKEVVSCSPQPGFETGMFERVFQRMAVICSFLLHSWGRICQPLVTPIIML